MYSIKISEEAKFKFNENPEVAVYEQKEEFKQSSNESIASSLVTEEDTSGNPLPPEVIEIRRKNKRMQKNLTSGLMNYKSTSRSLLDSEVSRNSQEDKKIEENEFKNEKKEKKIGQDSGVKGVLEQIMKLNGELEAAKKKVDQNKSMISVKELEFLQLSRDLDHVEENLKSIAESRKVETKCNCRIF